MRRAALLLGAAVLALLVSCGSSNSSSRSACANGGGAPAWSPTGRWIAWAPKGIVGICFAHPDGTDRRLLHVPHAHKPPYQLVWARPNLLVAQNTFRIYSIAFRPTPHVLAPGRAFSGPAGERFSLDTKADLFATANKDATAQGAGLVLIMRPGSSFASSVPGSRTPRQRR